MINEFEVNVWGGTMYDRLAQVYDPAYRLTPAFNSGHLYLSQYPKNQNLFEAMDLTIYPLLDRYKQYSSVFQAEYRDPKDAIWTPEQVNSLRGMLESKSYKAKVLKPQEGAPPMLLVEFTDQSCLLRTFTTGAFDRNERVLEIIFALNNQIPFTLENNEAEFLRRVLGWGELIKDTVDIACQIKAKSQSGVFRIGTIHFMHPRSDLEDELGL